MGDSITYGSGGAGGYRLNLYIALTNAGYNVDMVGTQTGNTDPGLGAEINHEGHGGWRITNPVNGLYDFAYSWFEAIEEPHVILLHIGTNDSGGFNANTNDINNLDRLITRLTECQPSAQIIVTSLLKRGEPNYTYITNYFNPYVPGKVTGQQALGRHVTFLDMHAYVPLSDMPDNLHPNAAGYAKMAAAWFPAITNVIGTNVVANQPALLRAVRNDNQVNVTISFNKKVSYATATNLSNYAIDNSLAVLGASLSANQRTVTLTTSPQTGGTNYTVTVNNVSDETAPTALTLPADSKVSFIAYAPPPPRGYSYYIPESSDYTLVYSLDLPNSANYTTGLVPYSTDNSAIIGPFSRIAYYLELQRPDEDLQYLWVSMDAFTNRADKLGVPTFLSGAVFQKTVNNMNVVCNVPGVTNGTGLTTGNIEFWPWNYSGGNALGIPGANGSTYDFGDTCSYSGNYGCMQVHNYGAKQTLFAFNHWNGATPQIGIGNYSGAQPDYTTVDNASTYTIKSMQVLVLCDPSADTTPPAPVSAQAGSAGNLVTVTFSETLSSASVASSAFALDNGVQILSATLLSDLRTVNLLTTRQPLGTALTLTVGGVRDLAANPVPEGTTLAVSAAALPPEIVTNAGALATGYQLVYTLDIPLKGNFNGTSDFYRYNQSGVTTAFDRVAYYLELQKSDGTVQYLWTSMDAFTADAHKTGVPIASLGTAFQRYVSHLDVKSNVAGVSNGVSMTGGNLEFWASSYTATNTAGIPGASDTAYDFGDSGGTATAGHGCMQIHNSTYGQTLFGMSNWGTDNQTLSVGIGNQSSGSPDWTSANNAGSYARRVLHVLVRPTAAPALPPPPAVAVNVPESSGYQLAYTIDLPVNASFNSAASTYYTVNNTTNGLSAQFSRIAYYLELQSGSNPTQWVWTAMDAFTTDATKIGVPVSGYLFQQRVSNLQVRSNAGGIVTGDDISTGNIEFWPSSYNGSNAIGIPNANNNSSTGFDFGDGGAGTSTGYGSMQVHNYATGVTQTLFAVNNFNNNASLCVGIGNNSGPTGYLDWTHAYNAGSYTVRRLHVFVLPSSSADVTPPTLAQAMASITLDKISVLFSETLADNAAALSNFALNNGATVIGATLLADMKTVVLTTSGLTASTTYTLTVTGVRDRSANGNFVLPGTSASFTTPAAAVAPDVLTNVLERADYELVHQVAIGNSVSWVNGCNYSVDESRFPRTTPFDRIAYCMELQNAGTGYHWVYVSMDAFTADLSKIGVPTVDRGAIWQQYVSNLNVYASANIANATVTTGTGIVSGNIEFWFSNYAAGNIKSIPGASASYFDSGDDIAGNTGAGHGSMQVHNYLQGHTLFSMVHFGNNNYTPGLGIGNNPNSAANSDPDWTFQQNAASYTLKNFYVLVRPAQAARSGTPPEIWRQPRSQTVFLDDTARLSVYAPGATAYQWRKDGVAIPGATEPWLDFAPPELADGGVYDVLVTGPAGYTTSQTATLDIIPYTHPQPPNTIRIMPVGDSITYGSGTAGGYRLPLYVALTNAGYVVDYVGTRTDNSVAGLGAEINHDGLSGWTIGQIDANIIDWLYAIDDPDVVLLHIGTNDSGAGDFSNRVDQLDALVTKIATNRPNANIVVTTLLKRSDLTRYAAITNYFNPYVEGKVLAQQALGRKVHYLDMHAHLELTDMYDGLHPNAGGYAKMAAAWFPVITNTASIYGDDSRPALARAVNLPALNGVQAVFTKALDPDTATDVANYALNGGVTISGATLSADQRTVTLATSALTRDATYTLTVNNVKDYSWPVQQTVATDSSDAFRATVRGYAANVPEAAGYRLAYAINLPNAADYDGAPVVYTTDNTAIIQQPLSRIAYYLELQSLNGDLSYVWVSMDAFTSDVTKIGIPAKYTGAVYQQTVNNMNVVCNDPAVTPGTGIATGNIEFWPFDYGGNNTASIPGANTTLCDFGDERRTTGTYGCMQVHNYGAAQTLLAVNHWNTGTLDLGIGNQTAGQPDWTFAYNAGNLPVRSLYMLVATGADATPPTLVSAQSGSAGTLVTVTFSEALLADSVDGSRFSLNSGVSVVSATLLPDLKTVNLVTSPQPAGTTLTLTVTGVRDIGGGNAIVPGSTITVAAAALPPEVTANVGALANGYQLVYTLDIPTKGYFNGTPDFYRYDQSLATGTFDRVAYYMELVKADATTQYVWAAMDAFTPYRKQIGVPTPASKAVFQQYVTSLDVKSNVSGVTGGTGMSNGNIEFWPGSYSQANASNIVNASVSYFDFGDTRTSSGAGYGSMQVHNAGLSQVLFAMNGFGTDNATLDLGIGNRPDNNKDWTQVYNSGTYYRRKLHVMVRPSVPAPAADLPAEILANVPAAAAGYQVVCSLTNIPAYSKFSDTSWAATNYVVDRRGLTVPGSYSRIAYYLELQTATDSVPRYVWTSMDAFTTDPAKLGIPLSGTLFQQKVANLDVACNVSSVVTGTGIATGNIEFWPGNYNQSNAINIPGANAGTFDFGDGGASSSTGHGCMQVHNYGAQQTIWAINHFNSNAEGIGMGIGNGPNSSNPDYTFTYNASAYTRSIFHVLVLPGGDTDTVAPTITGAVASRSLDKVTLTFSEALSDRAAVDGSFALNNGVAVTDATLTTNKLSIVLTTSPMTGSQSYLVTVNGVLDRSSNGNPIAPNSTASFTAPSTALPPVLTSVPEIGDYTLIHQLAIGDSVSYIPNGAPYSVDESRYVQTNSFDRIAYCMELTGTNGFAQWVYVSMDAFTTDLAKIGVPTLDRSSFYQQYASNLNVYASANISNVTVTTGVAIPFGNLEFWPSNYSNPNALGIPGASDATYDFGDTATPGNYGSMQVHNTAAAQTVFSFSHWGGNGFKPILGIGNQPTGNPDWTFNENATAYSVKNLYVLVRWGGTTVTGSGPDLFVQPSSQAVRSGTAVSFYVQAAGATAYQWRRNGVWIAGATQPWLEFNPAQESDAATYDVLVYGASGTTVSESAMLFVYPAGTLLIFQ
jgi:lysophospholipase L1-like esterase